jgi:hypothetical protein
MESNPVGKLIYYILEYERKSIYSDNRKQINEKDIFRIYNENRELKENKELMLYKIQELEKLTQLKDVNFLITQSSRKEYETFKQKESLYNKSLKIQRLKEKEIFIANEMSLADKKIAFLKSLVDKTTENPLNNFNEETIFAIFNDICIKSIDKKEEIKKSNKMLMEKLIQSIKEYKNLKEQK